MFDVCIIKAMKRGNLQGMPKKKLTAILGGVVYGGLPDFYSLVAYRGKGPVSDRQTSTHLTISKWHIITKQPYTWTHVVKSKMCRVVM